ncbi:hypothetical protein PILCRDRAFT_84632 [Piloderma croceum F 1598]|uniref:Uncharacterized protein n=1 Tax=Piloderma croceum (strain F 1598) TaxID=765440 RepID=A0A0C3BT57_PILCF|nr:hypothetical protein PILCRDRAFT_84632 [Piloderma croceum F 1598]
MFRQKKGGNITKCRMFHVGNGSFEIQYVWHQAQISAGTELAQRLVFVFGLALLLAGFLEHSPAFSNEMRSGFGKECCAVEVGSEEGSVPSELIGETNGHLHNAMRSILERGDDKGLECEEN